MWRSGGVETREIDLDPRRLLPHARSAEGRGSRTLWVRTDAILAASLMTSMTGRWAEVPVGSGLHMERRISM